MVNNLLTFRKVQLLLHLLKPFK